MRIDREKALFLKFDTQEDYDDLVDKDSSTLYIITTRFLVWGTAAWGRGVWSLQDE